MSLAAGRTVTLLLQGGHLIRLSEVDVASLVQQLEMGSPASELIEVQSSTSERLVVRRDALLGFIEGYDEFGTISTGGDMARTLSPPQPFIQIPDFLDEPDRQRLLDQILAREKDFEVSTVSTGRNHYRNSVMLREDSVIGPFFRHKLQNSMPDVANRLGVDVRLCDLNTIECQITAHRDGGFYHAHNDNGSPETATRILSYVYYMRARSQAFFGGELKLYLRHAGSGLERGDTQYSIIRPVNNSIVFFLSSTMHEVLPTYVPSEAFSDSRFTVNGWIRRS